MSTGLILSSYICSVSEEDPCCGELWEEICVEESGDGGLSNFWRTICGDCNGSFVIIVFVVDIEEQIWGGLWLYCGFIVLLGN